ncbi:MAG: ATP-binding protein [Anaerolineaceae bacterium]
MDSFFSMTFNLLTTPPGNYLYYIILAIFAATTLQSTYLTRRRHLDEARTRVMIGMFIVLLIQILFLSSSILGWGGFADPRQYLPPIDRAAILLMVTVIFWVWGFPEPSRLVDTVFVVVGLIIVFFLSGNLFNQSSVPPEMAYNASTWDWVWQVLTMITALVAIMVLANRRPENWQIGVGFFGVILLGYVINLSFLTNQGSFSSITRLAHLVAFLLLPTIAQRFQPVEVDDAPQPEFAPEKTTGKRDFKELETWLELNAQHDVESFFPALTRLVCQTMHADRAFVVVPSDSRGQISFQAGYNSETDEYFPLSSASDAILPAITRAAFFSRSQLFDHNENNEELNQLAVTAQIAAIGGALFTPFAPQQKKWGGLLVIKAATRKAWAAEDEERLSTLVTSASLVLDKIVELSMHAQSLKNMALELETTRRDNITLQENLKKINEQSGYERAEPELNALLAVQQESQDFITSLQRENRQLMKEIEDLRGSEEAGEEGSDNGPSRYAVELAAARERIKALEEATRSVNLSAAQARLVETILNELREPIETFNNRMDTFLTGADRLDQESEEQLLKSLQASLEKIHSQISDLEQMQVLEKGVEGLEARATDLAQIIDQAMAATRTQLSQKALNLRIGLPEDLPTFYSYPGTLKQALVHVLENAIEASAIGADIEMKVQNFTETNDETPYLLFQVTDWGGGRNMDEIRQVFTRRDGEMRAITDEGRGGIFHANRLVEAHGGRIWLDKENDGASVFSILLPLHPGSLPPIETD